MIWSLLSAVFLFITCCSPHLFLTTTIFELCLSFSAPHINTAHHDLTMRSLTNNSLSMMKITKKILRCMSEYCCYSNWTLLRSKHFSCSLPSKVFLQKTSGNYTARLMIERGLTLIFPPTFIILLHIYCYTHLTLWHFLILYVQTLDWWIFLYSSDIIYYQ